jgi:prophage maintenance system killer protein
LENNLRRIALNRSFLRARSRQLTASDEQIVQVWTDLAAGRLSQAKFAEWLRAYTTKMD